MPCILFYAFKTLFSDEVQGFTKAKGIQKLRTTVQGAAFKGSLQCGEHSIMYITQWGITHGKVSLPERKIFFFLHFIFYFLILFYF